MDQKSHNAKIKLLVTGASGFIGHEVARQLSIGGYHPRLMYRQCGDDCEICRFDADFVMADLRSPNSLKAAGRCTTVRLQFEPAGLSRDRCPGNGGNAGRPGPRLRPYQGGDRKAAGRHGRLRRRRFYRLASTACLRDKGSVFPSVGRRSSDSAGAR